MTRISAVITELASRHARGLPSVGELAREGRNEGGAHRPFGEEVADEVGDAKRDAKGVHRVAGAEVEREHLVANQPEHAAGHGGQAKQSG